MSPPTPTLGRVFVSSVFGGMMELRELAGEMTRLIDLEPALTEDVPAHPESVQSMLEGFLEGCDTYVGVFDTRRGTVPAGQRREKDRAITEQEYLLARELGLRCFVFLSTADDRDPELQEFLDTEVTAFATGVWSGYYDSPDDLAKHLVTALAQARPRMRLTLDDGRATLDLAHVKPVWNGPDTLEAEVDLTLSPISQRALELFLGGERGKTASEDGLRILGAELFERAFPDDLGQAVTQLLGKSGGRLVLLEVQADDPHVRYLPWELLRVGARTPVREGNLEVVRRLQETGHTPKPPADHLSVLGFTASSIEDRQRRIELGLEGGQASDADLFWETEQEMLLNALAPLISEQRARLVLPDEGSRSRLQDELGKKDRPRILHVSCHGGKTEQGEPALFLEDDDGRRAPTTAGDLLGWYRATPGAEPVELAVLSSCYTAAREPGDVGGPNRRAMATAAPKGTAVASLAEDLATGGIKRTLGMQTAVSDRGALAFAKEFYETLSRGSDLPCALRAGRQALKTAGSPHEWAIPVLLSTGDVGPLVSPRRQQTSVDEALVASRESPYAMGQEQYLTEGYAGRRDFERRLGHAVAQERAHPIAIHGLGGLGKSTLAVRFLQRRRAAGERVWALPVEERLPPEALEAEVLEVLGIQQPEGVPEHQAREVVRAAIQQVLDQRCHLLLDNFEVQQHEDGSWIDEETGRFLRDLKKLGGRDFTLLVTTRLELPGARNLDLGELPSSALRKFRLQRPPLERLEDAEWDTAVEHLGGHPKALEILAGYLQDRPERKRKILKAFENIREHVHDKLSEKDQERGRALLVDEVLEAVPERHRPTFDRLCLLRAPLPTDELLDLLEAEGIEAPEDDLTWLRQRGLLAHTVAPSALLGGDLVHRLLASPWKEKLAQREGDEAAHAWHRRVAKHFAQRKGPPADFGLAAHHLDAAGDRAGAMGMYNRWAIQLRDRHAYRAAEQVARDGLRRFGEPVEPEEKVAAAAILLTIHDALLPLGGLAGAKEALAEADRLLDGLETEDADFHRASVALRQGRLSAHEGRIQQAVEAFERAAASFEAGGKDQAIALGELARLKAKAGDVQEALRIHQEELQTYEQIGDVRSRAVTLGDIARLKAQAGDVQEALRIHQEQIQTYEQIGDVRARAVTLGDIARLKAQAGDVQEALRIHQEELQTYEQIGDVRERAVTLGDIARLKAQAGDVQEALELYQEILKIVEELGEVKGRAVILGDVARLKAKAGDVQEALRIHQEQIQTYEQIGDVRSRAVTLGDIAQLKAQAGDVDAARELQEERLEISQNLGDIDAVANTSFYLAQLDLAQDKPQDALPRLLEAWKINLHLGRADGIAFVGKLLGHLLAAFDRKDEAEQVLTRSEAAFRKLGMEAQAEQVKALREGL